MRLEKNLPLVQLTVNGAEILTFILDSAAAGCVMDGRRAAALGLRTTSRGVSLGSGGPQAVGIIDGVSLDLAGIRIVVSQCYAFDMAALAFKGRVDGILGFPLFGKYVVEIDYPRSRVRIFSPGAYSPAPAAQVLPLRMTTGPVVQGSIRLRGKDTLPLDMQLDTGSAHVLTVCSTVVDRHKLLDSADELASGSTLGLGGPAADMVGRIEELRIGRFAANKPLVRFSRQTTGTLSSDRHYSANIGGEFLKHYTVTFDIPGSRLVLE